MPAPVSFSIALGEYPHTQALMTKAPPAGLRPIFCSVKPVNRAFAPMVRDQQYDVAELAIMTFLQAKAHGAPLVLMPIVTAARAQERALLCRADDGSIKGPADLAGKTVGSRLYAQTTGGWLRGTLDEKYGVAPSDIDWVTWEGSHVVQHADPAWVRRAGAGEDMLAMLKDGTLDAAIFGNDLPDDPALRTVFPDPDAAGREFRAEHGFTPVNHMVVICSDVLEADPGVGAAIFDWFRKSGAGLTAKAVGDLDAALATAVRFADRQGLLPRRLTPDEVWAGWSGSRKLRS